MTGNLLKRSALAAAITLIPAVGFAENTVPFPDFLDPTEACQKLPEAIAANTNASNARAWPGMKLFTADDFKEVANKCIAKDQRGYNIVKQLWSELSQEFGRAMR